MELYPGCEMPNQSSQVNKALLRKKSTTFLATSGCFPTRSSLNSTDSLSIPTIHQLFSFPSQHLIDEGCSWVRLKIKQSSFPDFDSKNKIMYHHIQAIG